MKLFNYAKNAFKEKNIRKTLSLLLLSLIVFNFFVVIFSYGVGINSYDEYDFLEGVVWSNASINSGKIISDTFNYPYIVAFGSNIIMFPFVAIFGESVLANQLGMVVYFILYLTAIFALSSSIFDDYEKVINMVSLVSLFIFTYVGDNLLHHILYYGISFICFLMELCSLINIAKGKNLKRNYLTLIIFCLWSSINGIATIVLSNFAVCAGLVLITIYKNKNNLLDNKLLNDLKPLFIIVLVSIIGFALNVILCKDARQLGDFGQRFLILGVEDVANNMHSNIIKDYLRCFYVDGSGDSLLSIKGLYIVAQLLSAIVLFISPFITFKRFKILNDDIKFISFSCVIVFVICYLQYILTSSSERYLFNAILCLYLITAINFVNIDYNNIQFDFIYKIILVLLVLLLTAKNVLSYVVNNARYNKQKEVVKILEEHNLEYGFSKYAISYEVISNGRLKPIYISVQNNISKGRESIEEDRFKDIPDTDQFFVVLPDYQYERIKESESILFNNAMEMIECEDFFIYVFDVCYWNDIK